MLGKNKVEIKWFKYSMKH